MAKKSVSLAAFALATTFLVGCSGPTPESINGIGGSLPPDAVVIPSERSFAPTPTPSAGEVVLPPVKEGAIDGMPAAIDENQIDLAGASVPGFDDKQLRNAAAWAAAFTQTRYTRSGQWQPEINRSAFTDPVTFYVYIAQMAPETQKEAYEWVASSADVEKNRKVLESLVPLPPSTTGEWMTPAVGNFSFGNPKFTEAAGQKDSLIVSLPYAAYAVYGDRAAKEFYAVEIRDTATYTLTLTPEGWRIAAWAGAPEYGTPERLAGQPADRFFSDYTVLEQQRNATEQGR